MAPRGTGRGSGVAFALLLLSGGGCGERADAGDLTLDGLPVLSLEPELRLGSFDDPEAGFSRVGSVDVDDEGNLYVLEAQDREIRVYSPDGERLRTIGGPGDGPGEFGTSPWFGVQGDTLWTIDSRAERITLLDLEGEVLSTGRIQPLPVPVPNGVAYIYPRKMRPDGLFSGQISRILFRSDPSDTGVEEGDPIPVPRVLFDANGAVVDTLGSDPSPPPRMVPPRGYERLSELVEVGDARYRVPTPPPELPMWWPVPDGRIEVEVPYPSSADEGVVRVTRVGLAGDTVYHRLLTYTASSYSMTELDEIARDAARGGPVGPQGGQQGDNVDAVARALRDLMDFPTHRPGVRFSEVGQDESVWLYRDDPEAREGRWVRLDPRGIPVGEVRLPPDARIRWSGGDRIWVVEPDELDVPWLVRYRIGGG